MTDSDRTYKLQMTNKRPCGLPMTFSGTSGQNQIYSRTEVEFQNTSTVPVDAGCQRVFTDSSLVKEPFATLIHAKRSNLEERVDPFQSIIVSRFRGLFFRMNSFDLNCIQRLEW